LLAAVIIPLTSQNGGTVMPRAAERIRSVPNGPGFPLVQPRPGRAGLPA